MKVAILAGGLGSRLSEETVVKPKPMVEIGGTPILMHIMRHYAHYGHREFFIALGYKGELIKRYMMDFATLSTDLIVQLGSGCVTPRGRVAMDWTVHLIDTGQSTLTAGRLKQLLPLIGNETFMLTWGDGVSDIDLDALLEFHRGHGKLATVTVVRPPARYGHIRMEGDRVTEFTEKPQLGEGWINGAFFVLEPGVSEYLGGEDVMFESLPMENLARAGELMAFRHTGFWQCMDTMRERHLLERMWKEGRAPWKVWSDD